MTATEFKNLWPYLMVRLVAITVLVLPMCAGISIPITDYIFSSMDRSSFKLVDLFLGWGYTFIYGTWSFFLCVLIPYSLVVMYTQIGKKNTFVWFSLFYLLLTLMGIIFPNASVTGFAGFPKLLVLAFFLTITICPLVNIALKKMVMNRQN